MKKEETIDMILGYVKLQKINKGGKLPSERELAQLLKISRATIREAVSILEERKILTVKMSSGIYLAKSIKVINSLKELECLDEAVWMEKQLEACLMISPVIIFLAADCAKEKEIGELQDCIVKMSRAIVSKDIEALIEADYEFHFILAMMTKNYSFVKIMEHLNSGNRVFWEYFIKKDEFINNVIFAGYIEIVNAIRQKDSKMAKEMATKNINNFCRLVSDLNLKNNKGD